MQQPNGDETVESAGWSLVETRKLFDMLDSPRPGHGLLGVSDPDIHHLDGRWCMVVGAMNSRFRVRLYEARLPEGADITDDCWQFVTDDDDHAVALGAPEHGAWDSPGMHSPTYVRGPANDRTVERIYYAGQLSRAMSGKRSRYAIGYLERSPGGQWVRHSEPVLYGDDTRPSAMEPYVLWAGGQWRMWYLACVGEVGRGELPDYEMRYTTSEDGQTWTTPERFATTVEGFFNNTVIVGDAGSRMIAARGTNLHGTDPFPSQGLWLADTTGVPGDRASWQPFERLLDTDTAAEPWYAAGICGPACVLDGDDTMHIFATGTHSPISWYRAIFQQLRRRRPVVPAPFYLATARFTFRRSRGSSAGSRSRGLPR